MSYTKRQLVEEAFTELGLGDAFNIPPEDKLRALRRMEAMIAQWETRGIALGYALPLNPVDSNLDDASGIADKYVLAVQMNLAMALAPSFGKAVATETRQQAKAYYDALLIEATTPPQQQLRGGMPLGAGNRNWNWSQGGSAFTPEPNGVLTAGGDELET